MLKAAVRKDGTGGNRKHGHGNKHVNCIHVIILLLFSILANSIFTNICNASIDSSKKITVLYFYFEYCKQCNEAGKIIEELNNKETGVGDYADELDIRLLDASDSSTYRLLKKYFKEYNVPCEKQGVPIVFIGDVYLHGKTEIAADLKREISRIDLPGTKVIKLTGSDADTVEMKLSVVKMISVFLAGLVNGLNPCSLSLLLMFISMIMVKKVSVRKMGFTFAASKFITFFLLGTLLYSIFAHLKIKWFGLLTKGIILIFVVTIVILNINDYFSAKSDHYEKIKMQLPVRLRKACHEWIKNAVSGDNAGTIMIMSFLLGMIITFGEFLCTGQIYLATIVYILQSNSSFTINALFYFLIYDIAFILPLLIITVAIDRGRELFDISEALRGKLPAIKLINAGLFLIFGVLIVVLF